MRPRGSAAALLAAAALAVASLLAPTAPSAAAPLATPAVAGASAASDASAAVREARALRREAGALMREYLVAYGDRLSSSERAQMDRHRAAADRHLASVVVTTRRLSQLVGSSASAERLRTAVRAATSAHHRARAAAETSFDAVRTTLEPRLSLWEGLQALRDYDAMMGRFDDLGDRLDDVAGAAR